MRSLILIVNMAIIMFANITVATPTGNKAKKLPCAAWDTPKNLLRAMYNKDKSVMRLRKIVFVKEGKVSKKITYKVGVEVKDLGLLCGLYVSTKKSCVIISKKGQYFGKKACWFKIHIAGLYRTKSGYISGWVTGDSALKIISMTPF